jgi:hypothetical protein
MPVGLRGRCRRPDEDIDEFVAECFRDRCASHVCLVAADFDPLDSGHLRGRRGERPGDGPAQALAGVLLGDPIPDLEYVGRAAPVHAARPEKLAIRGEDAVREIGAPVEGRERALDELRHRLGRGALGGPGHPVAQVVVVGIDRA